MTEANWLDDPQLPGQLRYHDGINWTSKVSEPGGTPRNEPYLGAGQVRYQYAVAVCKRLESWEEVRLSFAKFARDGWEHRENWGNVEDWHSMKLETGFLFRRPVPAGHIIPDDEWCITVAFKP